ncbi:hypothetical protein AX14_010403 [Amanita brunnescens Koide BX004]|nr:hypothetical protein AX14_010403 [Amanita brunnescens Koide BX004]
MLLLTTLLLVLPLTAYASTNNIHEHNIDKRHPNAWYQDSNSPVHAILPRGSEDVTYAPVGSPAWSSGFPGRNYDPSKVPQAWKDALQAAIKAGKIPDIPLSKNKPGTNPVYPAGVDPTSPEVCSATYKCRASGDVWDAPEGVFGTSFDDGPLPYTPKLVDFLASHGIITTHFMIGINILGYPTDFLAAFDKGHDIAVHTWTHPYMTTLSNEELVAEFGWTTLLIYNSTGGKIPKYWRPPYGDCDNRVRAIAKEVFGLTTVVWNQDTEDWSLTVKGGTTPDKVQSSMEKWLSGPKSPGLIILEHELSTDCVDAFIKAFPLIQSKGWKIESVARLSGGSAFQDTDNLGYKNAAFGVSHDADAPQHSNNTITGKSTGPISAPFSYKAFNSASRQIPGFFSVTILSGLHFRFRW